MVARRFSVRKSNREFDARRMRKAMPRNPARKVAA
jgi:hypothetical protein